MSIRKIQELLTTYLDTNGWEPTHRWNSPAVPVVLVEYWKIKSRWSPADATAYIGFENWDIYESVGLSKSSPVPGEKNSWIIEFSADNNWQSEYESFVKEIDRLRDDWNSNG